MDIQALFDAVTNYSLLLIPLILGLTEVLKRTLPDAITDRWTPLICLALATAGALLFIGVTRQAAVVGIVIGLSASGLWSGGKTLLKDSSASTNKGFIRIRELFLLLALSLVLATVFGCASTHIRTATVPEDQGLPGFVEYCEASYSSLFKNVEGFSMSACGGKGKAGNSTVDPLAATLINILIEKASSPK